MKTLLLFLLTPIIGVSQVMYSWVGNPGWTASHPSNTTLSWQSSISTVSTSGFNNTTGDWYTYSNNTTNYYTSGVMDLSNCPTSSFIQVNVSLSVNLESNFDFLYLQYSTNSGVTWTNVASWTGGLGVINPVYFLPKSSTAAFRFVFVSDVSVNSYYIGATQYVYYADILNFSVVCPTILSSSIVHFDGVKTKQGSNNIYWELSSVDVECDYYFLERSKDGVNWTTITECKEMCGNTFYNVFDERYTRNSVNYYRLSKILNGSSTLITDVISIDNRTNKGKIEKIVNLLGQEVDENVKGYVFVYYSDGSIERQLRD